MCAIKGIDVAGPGLSGPEENNSPPMPKIPSQLPVYGGSGEFLFDAEGEQITDLILAGQVRQVGSRRKVHALYWVADDDERGLALSHPPVGQRTTWREPVGDTKIWAHRNEVCLNWGNAS